MCFLERQVIYLKNLGEWNQPIEKFIAESANKTVSFKIYTNRVNKVKYSLFFSIQKNIFYIAI